jgi:hypothetical protein
VLEVAVRALLLVAPLQSWIRFVVCIDFAARGCSTADAERR